MATSAPGYDSIRPNSAAPLAEVLKLNGYCIGTPGAFHHVVEVAATVVDAAGLPAPQEVHGIAQQALHGVSMRHSFDDPAPRVDTM